MKKQSFESEWNQLKIKCKLILIFSIFTLIFREDIKKRVYLI